MFENLSGFVASTMDTERMRRTVREAQVAEALRTRPSRPVAARGRTIREPIATALIALAARLAPASQTTRATSSASHTIPVTR